MTYQLTVDWLPEKTLVAKANPAIVLPADYQGTNTHPRLVDMFVDAFPRFNEVEIIRTELNAELGLALHAFYAPQTPNAYLFAYGFEQGKLNPIKVIETLYLANHFGDSVPVLLATMSSLRRSDIAGIYDEPLPDAEAFRKFISTREWFLDENFMPPLDFVWNISQYWDKDTVQETLISTNGEIQEIMRLLATGFTPQQIKDQVTGTSVAVPTDWLNQILGILDEKEENK